MKPFNVSVVEKNLRLNRGEQKEKSSRTRIVDAWFINFAFSESVFMLFFKDSGHYGLNNKNIINKRPSHEKRI